MLLRGILGVYTLAHMKQYLQTGFAMSSPDVEASFYPPKILRFLHKVLNTGAAAVCSMTR